MSITIQSICHCLTCVAFYAGSMLSLGVKICYSCCEDTAFHLLCKSPLFCFKIILAYCGMYNEEA